MDLQKDLLLALSGKTETEIASALDAADTAIRETIAEVKPEWPVFAVAEDEQPPAKLPQEYPESIREALAQIAVQVLNGKEIAEPDGLRQAIIDTRVSTEL